MRKWWYWIAGVVIALVGLATFCAYLSRPSPLRPGVTWANVERIKVGMTQRQVAAIMGRLAQLRVSGSMRIKDTPNPPKCHTILWWSDMECDILVYLDRDGRVIGREGIGSDGNRPPTWYNQIRKSVGL